jgi:hypothetical protein
MKKSELKQIIKEEIQKTMLVDRIYNALSEIDEFKQLGMDQQGELVTQIEDLFTEYNLNESEFDKAMDKFKEKIGFKKPDPSIKNVMREKEYEVEYWYRFGKYGDDEDNEVIKVKAPSEKEAIEKAKKEARKNAIASSFKVKK